MHSEVAKMTRRQVVAGVAAAAGLAGCASGDRAYRPAEGLMTYSESVHTGLADSEGRNFVSIRLCQYPDDQVAWIWMAALLDGEFWQFADNSIAWPGASSFDPDATHADYIADAGHTTVRFSRDGLVQHPQACGAEFASEKSGGASLEVSFNPASQFVGLIPGRAEVFGTASAKAVVRGREVNFAGPAQWHEQQQTDPRFVVPFVYASLWGEGTYSTLLETPQGSGGYIIHDNAVTPITRAEFSQPAASRQAGITTKDGATSDIQIEEMNHYFLDIYGKPWRGAFVKSRVMDVPVCGIANTWLM